MKCKGAIFDMDGLLFDTEAIYQQTWNEIAEKKGIQLPKEFVKDISGTNGDTMCRVIESYYGVIDGKQIQKECMARIKKKLEIHVPKKPGVDDILRFFKENNFRIAVASSSTKSQIESNLALSGIKCYFDAIVSGSEVKKGKPEPDIFLLAAERIKCRPEECYVFEDSINGIKAGHRAGCKAIMIPDLIKPTEEIKKISDGIYDTLIEAMTSMEMPAYEMGVKATDMVIEEIEAPADRKPTSQHLVFSSKLEERESG